MCLDFCFEHFERTIQLVNKKFSIFGLILALMGPKCEFSALRKIFFMKTMFIFIVIHVIQIIFNIF